jgi:hypothetical protein
MSEKIYALLLRLFPSHFRDAYGEEALQLFCDRDRDEKGFFPRLRLWLDLLADLAISVPREYRFLQPALIGAAAQQRVAGAPAFFVLGDGSVRPGALFFGSVLSCIALAALSGLINLPANHLPRRSSASAGHYQRANSSRYSAPQRPAPRAAADSKGNTIASTSQQPATAANANRSRSAGASLSPESSQPSRPQRSQLQDDASPAAGTAVDRPKLDAAERRRVTDAVIQSLKAHYVDPGVARRMTEALRAHEKSGDYEAVTDGTAFADLLTRQIRNESQDMHLEVAYSLAPLPASRFDSLGRPLGPTLEDLARYREALKQENCAFEKTEILAHNIGYLKLNAFSDPSICESTARSEMKRLNDAEAIIFDLRDNRGGEPEMVALMAAYLFDHPEYLYNPRENTTQQSWTQSPVPGNRLADKPVYILTSSRTFSGAEQFCYNLKMLKRATLVGETTGGAAHAGVFHRIDDHFGIGIPETRAINPYSKSDWATTGVEPDVKMNAAAALETALKLAERKLQKKQDSWNVTVRSYMPPRGSPSTVAGYRKLRRPSR